MKFVTDSHFLIGKDHVFKSKPCQDYAIAGQNKHCTYAIVSDGCSGGNKTDIGSRLVTMDMVNSLSNTQGAIDLNKLYENPDTFDREIGFRIFKTGYRLSLQRDDLLATCLYAVMTPNGGIIRVLGDGVVAVVYVDGNVTLHRFEWEPNVPFYPIYMLNLESIESFCDAHASEENPFTWETIIKKSNVEVSSRISSFPLEFGMNGATISIHDTSEIQTIVMFTDGVTQIDGMDWKDAAMKLILFKNLNGEFAKRRLTAFVKEVEKVGRGPIDDLSFSVIQFDHSELKVETVA